MSWQAAWFDGATPRSASLWRAVEAQHVISTLRLVDNAAEQELLEQLLEQSKPPLPAEARGLHYLLFTPFRYVSPWPSRFRPANRPGCWYGAEEVRTALAEVGYWRWRIHGDSEAFADTALVVQFTVFQAQVEGRCVDLCSPPWSSTAELWCHPTDYSDCHAVAAACVERTVAWIRYSSVRDPQAAACGAVLDASALSLPDACQQQTWAAKITAEGAIFSHAFGALQFDASEWV